MNVQVFVSSRMAPDELANERSIARHIIQEMDLEPILFEDEPAAAKHIKVWWRQKIEESDIVLLLLHKTLRWAAFDEFKHARDSVKEILVFLKDSRMVHEKQLEIQLDEDGIPKISQLEIEYFYDFVLSRKYGDIGTETQFQNSLKNSLWNLPIVHRGIAGELRRIKSVFVPPQQYAMANEILNNRGIVIISGPPHIGKTATARHLLLQQKMEGRIKSLVNCSTYADLCNLGFPKNTGILLDDPFGGVSFNDPEIGDKFNEISRLTGYNYVVITSREEILEEVCSETKMGERKDVQNLTVGLSSETSYTDEDLYNVLMRHLSYMHELHNPEEERISLDQKRLAEQNAEIIIKSLRFPHNIERLITLYLRNISSEEDLREAVESAKEIEIAVANWFNRLDSNLRWFVFVVTLFNIFEEDQFKKLYEVVMRRLNLIPEEVSRLRKATASYINTTGKVRFSHSSYWEGTMKAILENYAKEASFVLSMPEFWRNPDHTVRRANAWALGELGKVKGNDILPVLCNMAKEDNGDAAIAIARALIKADAFTRKGSPLLVESMLSSRIAYQIVQAALRDIKIQHHNETLNRDLEEGIKCLVEPLLGRKIDEGNKEMLRRDGLLLRQISSVIPDFMKEILIVRHKDINKEIRIKITYAIDPIIKCFGGEISDVVTALLQDQEEEVRLAVLRSLQRFASSEPKIAMQVWPDIVQVLCSLASDSKSSVRWRVSIILGKVSLDFKNEVLERLMKLAYDNDQRVRNSAVRRIRKKAFNYAKARRLLVQLKEHPDEVIRRIVARGY